VHDSVEMSWKTGVRERVAKVAFDPLDAGDRWRSARTPGHRKHPVSAGDAMEKCPPEEASPSGYQ
jgi:hypothetical protein